MNAESYPYPRSRHLIIAGCLALVTLATAVTYAWRSTPYTMVLFLGIGSTFLTAAILLFGWTVWKDLSSRLESMVPKQYAAGEIIFRQGEPGEHVYVITKGRVDAIHEDPAKGDVVVWSLGTDEIFGETAILSGMPRRVTARAVEAVEVLAIHRTEFLRLYESLPRFRARISAQQVSRKSMTEQAKKAE